jgi:hypothetical protein
VDRHGATYADKYVNYYTWKKTQKKTPLGDVRCLCGEEIVFFEYMVYYHYRHLPVIKENICLYLDPPMAWHRRWHSLARFVCPVTSSDQKIHHVAIFPDITGQHVYIY